MNDSENDLSLAYTYNKVKLPSVGFLHPPLMVSWGPHDVGHTDVATGCCVLSLCSLEFRPLRAADPHLSSLVTQNLEMGGLTAR